MTGPCGQFLSQGVLAKFPGLLLDVVIPKNTTITLATFERKPVALFDITAPGAASYLELAQEVIRADLKRSK